MEILSEKTRSVLASCVDMADSFGVNKYVSAQITLAKSYDDLVKAAIESLQNMRDSSGREEIVFFSGPLRSGSDTLEVNMQRMFEAMKERLPYTTFNQLLFFERITQMEAQFPNLDSMNEFFLPVIGLRQISEVIPLSFCDFSPNSQREIAHANSLGKIDWGR